MPVASGASQAHRREDNRPRPSLDRIFLTVPHLAFLGVVGSVVLSVLLSLIAAGVGLTVLFGLGLVLLAGAVYALFGIAWFEVERVQGLYRLDVAPLMRLARARDGFGGWLRALMLQSVDGRMWLAIASFAVGALLGVVEVRLAGLAAWNLAIMFGGSDLAEVLGPLRLLGSDFDGIERIAQPGVLASPLWSLLIAVLSIAAMFGIALLYAVIARALIGRSSHRALTAEVRERSAQRDGAVRAANVERTRIERDLHDGVQPRLVSIGMALGLAGQKIDENPEAAKSLIAEAHASTKSAITELRQLARGIHTSVLDDRGLDAALSALAGRSHIPVVLDVRMDGAAEMRQRESVFRDAEAAVYFSIAEAMTNAAKHSRAAECRVTVRLRDAGSHGARLWARVEDNGIGGAEVQPGGGLDGIANRLLAVGGELQFDSPKGGPTALEVSVPCAS